MHSTAPNSAAIPSMIQPFGFLRLLGQRIIIPPLCTFTVRFVSFYSCQRFVLQFLIYFKKILVYSSWMCYNKIV